MVKLKQSCLLHNEQIGFSTKCVIMRKQNQKENTVEFRSERASPRHVLKR